MEAYEVINGTFGTVWLENEEVAEASAFQVKVEFQKEEINIAGKMATDTKLMGYTIKGSLKLHKTNSRMYKLIWNRIKNGEDPRFTFIGKLADPNSRGAERIAVKNVSFDDLTVFDWETKSPGAVECPFTATDLEDLDLI